MAIEDESFYNIFGEEISRTILVNEMIKLHNLKVAEGDTQITDLNEGSEIRNLLEDVSVDMYIKMEAENELTKIAFIDTAEGEWLDKHGAHPHIKLERNLGDYAVGLLTFSVPEPLSEELIISEGTVVTSDAGLDYLTDAEVNIPVGETSITVAATCMTTGEDGNCESGEINTITDEYLLDSNISVVNSDAFNGGVDYEEDWDYRQRLLDYERLDDFGSVGYYNRICSELDTVHDVLLVDDNTYTSKVLVNGYTRPTTDEALLDVLVLLSDPNNVVLGHSFITTKPEYVETNITLDLHVTEEVNESAILALIEDFVNGGSHIIGLDFDGLNIGEGWSRDEFNNHFYVFPQVTGVSSRIGGESYENYTIDSDKAVKIGNITINQTVIGG